MLRDQQDLQQERRLKAGELWIDENVGTDLVFTTGRGTPIEPRNLYRTFLAICERTELRRIRLHDLRHTNATFLYELGVSDQRIQQLLGQSDLSVTRGYIHLRQAPGLEATEAVADLLLKSIDGARSCQNWLSSSARGHHSIELSLAGVYVG